MASLIDRLLGRTETTALIEQPTEAKAVTGPGAFAMTYHTPLRSLSRDPNKLMAEAQALFRTNGWVGTAERELGKRFVRMDWHLEDANGKTVDEKSPEPYQQPLRLLQRPSPGKLRSQVFGVTFRHVGLAGNAFWYLDERDMAAGTPLSALYVNPARITPAYDKTGNVTGWWLDHPDNQAVNERSDTAYRQGTPLNVDEVIHFTLDEPDWGIWGIGWVESAQRKIDLDRLADGHGGGILSSGGRLSGLVSPKAGVTVTDDQWTQFVRDWRSITSDPDAAKRLQVAKMPLDFTQMTVSPKELQLLDVSKQSRDDILAMAGVPLSTRGIAVPAGLNSDRGESDEAAVWETVKERSEPIRETIQVMLLDRWQAVGVKVTLIFDYPEFDDDTPKYESAAKAINAPITNDERRDILGLEPLEDKALGKQIWLHSSLVRIDEPEQQVDETPTALDTQQVTKPTDTEEEFIKGRIAPKTRTFNVTESEGKAIGPPAGRGRIDPAAYALSKADLTKPLLGLRQRAEVEWEPKVRTVVSQVLAAQQKLVLSKVEHAVRKNDLSWWNEDREQRRFMLALEPTIGDMARDVAQRTTQTVKKPEGKADTWLERVIEAVRSSVGARITGINRTTREKVQAAIATGVKKGMGGAEMGTLIRESAAFDEYRSELIARTETALVYNDSALHSYGALEVEEVEAIDGDVDAECAARNGKRFPIDEAMGITDHPNGTLDWIPVVKAVIPPDPMLIMAEAMKASMDRPPAVINVTTPDVHVTTPDVNMYPTFNMPENPVTVNMPETTAKAKATTQRVVRDEGGRIIKVVDEARLTTKRVIRDDAGRITKVVEE